MTLTPTGRYVVSCLILTALLALVGVAVMFTLSPAAFWVLVWAGAALTLGGLAVVEPVEPRQRVLEQQVGRR